MRAVITGVAALAAIACAPLAHADGGDQAAISRPWSVAGAPFVGNWGAHEERLTINADGTSTETYNDRSSCPNAPMAGCGVTGTVNFRLSTVQTTKTPWDTAYGNLTSGGKAPVGSYVTIQLVDGGNGALLSVANGDNGFPFCKIVNGSGVNSADCGA